MTTAFERSEKTGREPEGRVRRTALPEAGRNITLMNTARRMKVYNLPHHTYCKALGRCACTPLPGRDGRKVCASITLPAGGVLESLPEAVLEVADVLRDLCAGLLRAHSIPASPRKKTTTRKAKSSGRKRSR